MKKQLLLKPLLTLALVMICGSVWAAVESGTIYSTTKASSIPAGWTTSEGGGASNYLQLIASSHYLLTDEFETTEITKITVKARKYGGPTDAQAVLTISWISDGEETVLGTISPTSTTLTDYTLSSPVKVSGTGAVKFQCKAASSSKGDGISAVTITYKTASSKVLTSLAISGTPTQKSYFADDNFNPAGLTVTGTYNNGDEEPITEDITWAFDPDPLTYGTTSVDVTATVESVTSPAYTVSGLTVFSNGIAAGTYTINLNNALYGISAGNNGTEQSKTRNGITVVSGCSSSAGTKTNYTATHIRYYTGSYLKLTAPIGYEITKVAFVEPTVDDEKQWDATGITPSLNSDKVWTGHSTELTFSFTKQCRAASIEVTYAEPATVSSISISGTLSKTTYEVDEALDYTGLEVTAEYSDGTTADVTSDVEWSYSPSSLFPGENTISITATYESKTDTKTGINVIVKALDTISISGSMTKTSYKDDEKVDYSGLTVNANFTDGSSVDVTKDVAWSCDPATLTVGEYTISVTATYGGKTATKDIDISVAQRLDYVTLPFSWAGGGKSGLTALDGVTGNGLGSDYSAQNYEPYLIKFDDTGDYIQIKTDGPIYSVSIGVKMIGGKTTSTITVQGSTDGKDFTDIEALTISGAQNNVLNLSTTKTFDASYRYIKLLFTKGSNVGVGPISINKTHDVTISAVGQATACVDFDATVSGATAYYISSVTNSSAQLTPVSGVIPAGKGVLLKTDDGLSGTATFEENYADDDANAAAADNMLKGSIDGGTFKTSGYTYYILSTDDKGVVGFYWDAITNDEGKTAKCAPGKAVLAVPGASGSNVIRIEGTTGIDTIEATEEPTVIYDLTGRQVKAATNGIYIVNGKKMIIK